MKPTQSAEIRRTLTRKCAVMGIPASGTFELTPRCNLRCKMCYVRMTPEQMAAIGRERTAEEWLALGREACEAGMVFLLITGGEPTLRPDFPEIYEGLMNLGLSISINTNGTLLTPTIRELWHRLPPAQVNVTLYGTCSEDYANLCGDPSAFTRVVEGLDWLQAEGILVHLNTTITPINLSRWEEIEAFAKSRDLELRLTAYCFPPVRRMECDSCHDFSRLPPETVGQLIVQDIYYREGIESIARHAANLNIPIQHSCDLDTGNPMSCMAGRSQFWINWNGSMTPCGMLNEPVATPFEHSFLQAWSQIRREVDSILLCPDCAVCEERATCMNCAAVTHSETGYFNGKPEYMCKLNHAYRETLKTISCEAFSLPQKNNA